MFLGVRCCHIPFVFLLIKFVLYLWKLNLKVTPVNYGRYSVHHKVTIVSFCCLLVIFLFKNPRVKYFLSGLGRTTEKQLRSNKETCNFSRLYFIVGVPQIWGRSFFDKKDADSRRKISLPPLLIFFLAPRKLGTFSYCSSCQRHCGACSDYSIPSKALWEIKDILGMLRLFFLSKALWEIWKLLGCADCSSYQRYCGRYENFWVMRRLLFLSKALWEIKDFWGMLRLFFLSKALWEILKLLGHAQIVLPIKGIVGDIKTFGSCSDCFSYQKQLFCFFHFIFYL